MTDQPTDTKKSAAAPSRRKKPAQRDETDMFIQEVSEELERDKLFNALRRWGPFGLAALILIVAGVAFSEFYRDASAERARAAGAALQEAAQSDEPAAALAELADRAGPGPRAIALLSAASLRTEAGETDQAVELYARVAEMTELKPLYRDLARLRSVMLRIDDDAPDALISELTTLSAPKAPYRALALELRAAAYLRADETDEARRDLEAAMDAVNNPPQGLTARAGALLEALGGPLRTPDAPSGDAPAQDGQQ